MMYAVLRKISAQKRLRQQEFQKWANIAE